MLHTVYIYKCTLPSVHGNYNVKQCKQMSNCRTAFSTGMWDWNMEGNWKTKEWETEQEREQEWERITTWGNHFSSVQLIACLRELLQLQFKDQFSSFVWQVSVSWWNLMTSSSLDMSLLISYCVVKTYLMNTGLVEFTHQHMEVLCWT